MDLLSRSGLLSSPGSLSLGMKRRVPYELQGIRTLSSLFIFPWNLLKEVRIEPQLPALYDNDSSLLPFTQWKSLNKERSLLRTLA